SQRPPVDPTEQDKSPVGIAARGAAIRVAHLRLERDMFYRNTSSNGHIDRGSPYILNDYDDDQKDEFMILGDNSPRSNDSRFWSSTSVVQRRLLMGKVFCTAWADGIPFLNNGRGFPVGTYPEWPGRHNRLDVRLLPPVPQYTVPAYPQF